MIGSSGPLVLGHTTPHVFGMFEMRLIRVDVNGIELDDIGRMIRADLSFTLKQGNKKKFKKQSAQFPGESAKAVLRFWCENPSELPKQYESAVKISPDKNVKKLWKKRRDKK